MKIRTLLLAFISLSSHADILVVGDSGHPPYSYIENGEKKGIYFDIVNEALKDFKPMVKIEMYPWKRALKLVESGDAQAIFPPHYFPQRRPYISLYSQRILNEQVTVICNPDTISLNGQQRSWPSDFFGNTFALSSGVKMGGEAFWQAINEEKITRYEAHGPREALMMLNKGRVDCHVNDLFTLLWQISDLENGTNVHMQNLRNNTQTISSSGGHLGVSDTLEQSLATKLIEHFNTRLVEMHKSGFVQATIEKYTSN